MAKQMKKTLCVVLSVIMALSCFAVNAFAFTGYDNNGTNNDLRVQSSIAADKTAYSVGDTVTATITLNHPDDTVLGYQAYIAFDASKLEFQSAQLASDFEYYDESNAPSADSVVELDPTTLLNGFGGTHYNATTFARLIGTPTMTSTAVVHLAAINLTGVAAGNSTIATVSFEAKSAVSSTAVALVPSNVYKADFGFFDCVATLGTDGVYSSAFSATGATEAFEITGEATDVYYDITFTWNGGSEVVSTKENTMPEAPTVPGYSDGDYDYSFSTWSPALANATAAATYTAVYDSVFVPADYTDYNAAVLAATTKRDSSDNWTDDSLAALNAALAVDVSGLGRTSQTTVNAQTTAINDAAEALTQKAAVYTINFVVKGETVSSQQVTAGEMPSIPTVENYEDDAKTYIFTGWNEEVTAAAGDKTYTAQFSETWKEYDITFKWNGEQTVVKTHWGDTPVAPTVPNYQTESSTFVFAGWSPELKACDGAATYTATYNESAKVFTIKFVGVNGAVLQSEDLAYGVTPSYNGETPVKAADNTYTYSFAGWDNEIVAVTGDATYTATFNSTYIDYTVKFINEGTTVSEVSYHYGDTIVVPETPKKAADETYTYTFKAWTPEVPATVTGNAEFTATYDSTYIDYTVKFVWHDGEDTQTLHWGETPVAPTVPSYDEGGKTYSFAGWNPELKDCDGNVVYTATYNDTFIVYTITFVVGENQSTQQVNAGSLPTAPQVDNYTDGDYDVAFTGWDKTIVAAAGDTTYTAQFERTFVAADYSAVNTAKADAQSVNRNNYTADSLAVLDNALAAVQEGLGRTSQTQVNTWADDINTAIASLVLKPADYTAYNAAVTALQTELAKTDLYTPDSISDVTTQLTSIDTNLDKALKITAQQTVDTATSAVSALAEQLVIKADKSDLKSLIDQADALDSNKYVDFSAVETALSQAKTVYEDENATSKAVSDSIQALGSALSALKFKDADYTQWEALENQFNALELRYYDETLVNNVRDILASVERDKDINYQPTLDELTNDLDQAIKALDIIRKWEGETDFYSVEHEYFYSNLEFEKKSENNNELVIDVYLNHPSDKVHSIQVAALFDANVVEFDYAEAVGGTLLGANAADARFNPVDYGYEAMGKAGVVKFIISFDSILPETFAGRDHIATLHFKPLASGKTILKAVPLASNIYEDTTIYSAIYDENGTEKFMHSEWVQAQFTGIINGTDSIVPSNPKAVITAKLVKAGVAINNESTDANTGFEFNNVEPDTYEIQISARGSLGYTFKNVVVSEGEEIILPEVQLIFGNYNGNDTIDLEDLASIIVAASGNGYDELADVNGNDAVELSDVTTTITNYGALAVEQFVTVS